LALMVCADASVGDAASKMTETVILVVGASWRLILIKTVL
jgi:hypothetical protein